MAVSNTQVLAVYRKIQTAQKGLDFRTAVLSDLFEEILTASIAALEKAKRRPLTSRVTGKTYFAFEDGAKTSRAINEALYAPSVISWKRLVKAIATDNFKGLKEEELTKTVYSLAFAFFSVIDLTKTGDQKTPGTFFEYLIAHLFSSRLGVNPSNRLAVLNLDLNTTLPTDFVIDLGAGKPKFHLPVKTSTRERVIQVWAHQRVLDGVYGIGRFLGTPVIAAETKTDKMKGEVVEICLPDQWRIYQMHIAQLKRVYYLDVPTVYDALNAVFPPIRVAPFGRFFLEVVELSAP
jgi:hypothetical protein